MSWRTAVPGGGCRRRAAGGRPSGRLRRPYGRLMAGRAARARAGIVQKKILGGEGKQSAAGPLLPRPLWFFVLKKPEEPGERGGNGPPARMGDTRGERSPERSAGEHPDLPAAGRCIAAAAGHCRPPGRRSAALLGGYSRPAAAQAASDDGRGVTVLRHSTAAVGGGGRVDRGWRSSRDGRRSESGVGSGERRRRRSRNGRRSRDGRRV